MNRRNWLFFDIEKEIEIGTHIKITFGPKDTFSPYYLINMANAKSLTFVDKNTRNQILKIKNTSLWDSIPDRTIEIITTKLFNTNLFSKDMIKAENVEVVKS